MWEKERQASETASSNLKARSLENSQVTAGESEDRFFVSTAMKTGS